MVLFVLFIFFIFLFLFYVFVYIFFYYFSLFPSSSSSFIFFSFFLFPSSFLCVCSSFYFCLSFFFFGYLSFLVFHSFFFFLYILGYCVHLSLSLYEVLIYAKFFNKNIIMCYFFLSNKRIWVNLHKFYLFSHFFLNQTKTNFPPPTKHKRKKIKIFSNLILFYPPTKQTLQGFVCVCSFYFILFFSILWIYNLGFRYWLSISPRCPSSKALSFPSKHFGFVA